jgi:hypothetical protein
LDSQELSALAPEDDGMIVLSKGTPEKKIGFTATRRSAIKQNICLTVIGFHLRARERDPNRCMGGLKTDKLFLLFRLQILQ